MAVELRQLRYFVAVAEELHFGRAATRVFLTQPSLSYQVARLETELGVKLLTRDRRTVALTEVGRTFLHEARLTLTQLERAVDVIRLYRQGEPIRLKLGFVALEYLTTEVMRGVLGAVRATQPEAKIEFHELFLAPQVQAVLRDELDAGVLHRPFGTAPLAFEPLLWESFVLALPEHHPSAGKEVVDAASLQGERLLLYPREQAPEIYDRWEARAREMGMRVAGAPDVLQVQAMLAQVAAGQGVVAYPSLVAARYPGLGVVFKPVEGGVFDLELGVVWKAHRQSPPLQALLTAVRGFRHEVSSG
ncbi:LysR family transcriptional regulator [Deinococcus sp. Arct2-2]|uniref:LysR substrate-binding domain-containing protein n=1 Tax=Deinococcus sp. Arct2-2 TaxID=2568653 RepID=UPI0010A49D39|nr:LysR substrate-binding domain-containing protein [Deinococcus sp. Arct2-2]THF67740.1 LysR family transcriptional regulator [Deinococcus sp. Arct2-2]